MMISVIIPTRNRAAFLERTVTSVVHQTLPESKFEVLLIDNGSTDGTEEIVRTLQKRAGAKIQYFRVSEPGLHVGRHLGAEKAKGEILTFVDDDIVATPGWLEAIDNVFVQTNAALVGGKILSECEEELPDWIRIFKDEIYGGWFIGYLSLLDFGDIRREIPGWAAFGCNFSIRKSVLFECGGFHPDAMPQELIRFRGDGETGLGEAVQAKGYAVMYEPGAIVYHRVPSERLTIEYFCQRAFNQGITDSYAEIRRKRAVESEVPHRYYQKWRRGLHTIRTLLRTFLGPESQNAPEQHPYKIRVDKSYLKGRNYHRKQVRNDPELFRYILKENYF